MEDKTHLLGNQSVIAVHNSSIKYLRPHKQTRNSTLLLLLVLVKYWDTVRHNARNHLLYREALQVRILRGNLSINLNPLDSFVESILLH